MAVIPDKHLYSYLQSHIFDLYSVSSSERRKSVPFIQNVLLQGGGGEEILEAIVDDGAMANAIDEDTYRKARRGIGELEWSGRVLRMADGRIVPSRGRWCGRVTFGGVERQGEFEVFPSGGAWVVLFGKPLLGDFGAWHGYEEDVIMLRDENRTVRVENAQPRGTQTDTNNADPLIMMMAGPASRETITGGSSAPPVRQAPSPAPCTPVEQTDQPEITGQQLREHWRHKNSDRGWWRMPPSGADTTQEEAMGGRNTPPARQVQILSIPDENTGEHIVGIAQCA
jgi:hypothetical protein